MTLPIWSFYMINMLCSRWMLGTVETLAEGGREGSWAEEGS